MMDTPENTLALTFRLADETFAVTVDTVHEVLDPQVPTPVPNADPFCPGLINVRGVVVPFVDIRLKLGMSPRETAPGARVIVLDHVVDDQPTRLAFEADAVEEVIDANPANLEPVPDLGARWPRECLRGAFRCDGGLVVLLDNETLFAPARPVATD